MSINAGRSQYAERHKNIMLKEEFEETVKSVRCETGLTGLCVIPTEDYKIIEEVYMWYPTMVEESSEASRTEIATLFVFGGMAVINDMHRRAMGFKKANDIRENLAEQLKNITRDIDYIKSGSNHYEKYL